MWKRRRQTRRKKLCNCGVKYLKFMTCFTQYSRKNSNGDGPRCISFKSGSGWKNEIWKMRIWKSRIRLLNGNGYPSLVVSYLFRITAFFSYLNERILYTAHNFSSFLIPSHVQWITRPYRIPMMGHQTRLSWMRGKYSSGSDHGVETLFGQAALSFAAICAYFHRGF